jgi:hypothetical protein
MQLACRRQKLAALYFQTPQLTIVQFHCYQARRCPGTYCPSDQQTEQFDFDVAASMVKLTSSQRGLVGPIVSRFEQRG